VDAAARVRDLNFKYMSEGKGATVTARFGKDGITICDPNRAIEKVSVPAIGDFRGCAFLLDWQVSPPCRANGGLGGVAEQARRAEGGCVEQVGGVPDIERMRRFGVRWAYFVSWSGDQGARKPWADTLRRIYRSGAVSNR